MARISHTQEKSQSSNPTSKFLEWKSMDKQFSYYDKAAEENVKVDLPLKFVFLQHYHTVKGWNDASQSGIWSNEVYYIGSEPMNVRAFKGGTIVKGIYKDIKDDITKAGGKYHRSVYVMLEDGTIANLSFKGAVVREWSEFMKNNGRLVDNQWVEISSASDQKKGSIKFSVPEFTIGASLTKKDGAMADKAAAQLKEYLDQYFQKDEQSAQVEVEAEDVELDF